MSEQVHKPVSEYRVMTVYFVVIAVSVGLMYRAFDLQVLRKDFLQTEGNMRIIGKEPLTGHRGMILDRNGHPLAISTPIETVCIYPKQIKFVADASATLTKNGYTDLDYEKLVALAKILDMKPSKLKKLILAKKDSGKYFVFLKRHVKPDVGNNVTALKIRGVSLVTEYKRYYPTKYVTSHVLGFTNIDDAGQEGIELAYNDWLDGSDGEQLVIKDLFGQAVKHVDVVVPPRAGHDLNISIDKRLQYIAYRELEKTVQQHKASSGSVVIIDTNTGEVLAMVNFPSFNPNNRGDYKDTRNMTVTDPIEPGSTIKPFTVIAALESGEFTVKSKINTSPGYMYVGKNRIRDFKDYGVLNLASIIQKSSNVGATRIALAIPPEVMLDIHQRVGFGNTTGSGFPGEATGELRSPRVWRDIERATLSYGYGLSVTTLQLAQAYSVIANDGVYIPITFEVQTSKVEGQQVLNKEHTRIVREMLIGVVSDDGTGSKAQVSGYQVAGKTGTVKTVRPEGGYTEDEYISLFVGMIPADNPRLVMVVSINGPTGKDYYGGKVAAPVFSKVMTDAVRLLDIPPQFIPDNNKPLSPEKSKQFAFAGDKS